LAGDALQPLCHLRIRGIQVLGNAQKVKIGPVIDHGSGYGVPIAPPRLRMSANRLLADFT